MTGLQKIVTAAREIIQICEQERTNKADKEKLLKLQAAIFTHIEDLTECEVCGLITDLVVTMTIEPVTAKLCKDCGIKAIEAGRIKKPATRQRSTGTAQKNVPTSKKKSPPQQTSPGNIDELYVEVEKQTSLKKTAIKRLHKIIQEIASPMNLENTVLYVKHEVELAKLKIEQDALKTAVTLLMAA
jgi:D-hexose-6-phosphate mutarotase